MPFSFLSFFRPRFLETGNAEFDETRRETLRSLNRVRDYIKECDDGQNPTPFNVARRGHINRFKNTLAGLHYSFNNNVNTMISTVDPDTKAVIEAAKSPEAAENFKKFMDSIMKTKEETEPKPSPVEPENPESEPQFTPCSSCEFPLKKLVPEKKVKNPPLDLSNESLNFPSSDVDDDTLQVSTVVETVTHDEYGFPNIPKFSIFPKVEAAPREKSEKGRSFFNRRLWCDDVVPSIPGEVHTPKMEKLLTNTVKNQAVVIANYEKEVKSEIDKNHAPRFYICHKETFWNVKMDAGKERFVIRDGSDFHINNYAVDSTYGFDCGPIARRFNSVIRGFNEEVGVRIDKKGNAYVDEAAMSHIFEEINGPTWRDYYVPNIQYDHRPGFLGRHLRFWPFA